MHCTVYLWACGRNLNTRRSISYIVPVFVEHRAIVQDYIYIYLGIYLRPSDIGCQYSMSIYTVHAPSCGNLVVPRTRRRIGDRAFSICCCCCDLRAWNRLPTELKLLRSTDSFRRDLKTFLFHYRTMATQKPPQLKGVHSLVYPCLVSSVAIILSVSDVKVWNVEGIGL